MKEEPATKSEYNIWGFHSSEDSSCHLLGSDTAWCSRIPTFQRAMWSPSSACRWKTGEWHAKKPMFQLQAEGGGSMVLWNFCILPHHYMAHKQEDVNTNLYRRGNQTCRRTMAVQATVISG